jgi:hypothetical protein
MAIFLKIFKLPQYAHRHASFLVVGQAINMKFLISKILEK